MNFSVLMSVYKNDSPRLFSIAMKSITVEQTLRPSQVVLVVDGPIPKELEVCIDEFKHEVGYLDIVRCDDNVGLGKALNFGLLSCQHEIVFRMDADDRSLPKRFEIQMDAFRSNPDVDVLGGYIEEFCVESGNSLGLRVVPLSPEAIGLRAKSQCPMNHVTVGFKKSSVMGVGGYKHLMYLEDYYLWIRLLSNDKRMMNLPVVLVHVSSGESMISRRRGWVYVQGEWELYLAKKKLAIGSSVGNVFYLCLRAIPRMMPAVILKNIYKILRK